MAVKVTDDPGQKGLDDTDIVMLIGRFAITVTGILVRVALASQVLS